MRVITEGTAQACIRDLRFHDSFWKTSYCRQPTDTSYTLVDSSATKFVGDHVIVRECKHMGISSAFFDDSEIEMDGSWVAECIITRIPIRL